VWKFEVGSDFSVQTSLEGEGPRPDVSAASMHAPSELVKNQEKVHLDCTLQSCTTPIVARTSTVSWLHIARWNVYHGILLMATHATESRRVLSFLEEQCAAAT